MEKAGDPWGFEPPGKAVKPRATSNTTACDSCRRVDSRCLGGPVCERCQLHGFDCMFTAGAAISDLKKEFSSLLVPGLPLPPPYRYCAKVEAGSNYERTKVSCSGGEPQYIPSRLGTNNEVDREDTLLPLQSTSDEECKKRLRELWEERTSEKISRMPWRSPSTICNQCKETQNRCDEGRPRCSRCSEQGFECTYQPVSYPTITHNDTRYTPNRVQACDACRILKATCDEGRPSCSRCREKGIDCRRPPMHRLSPSSTPRPDKSNTEKHWERSNDLESGSDKIWLPDKPPQWQASSLRYPRVPPPPPPQYPLYAPYGIPGGPPVSYPLGHFSSIPSGCIPCFESKAKCTPINGSVCARCTEQSIECKSFPPGTRLGPCDSCIKLKKLCTNEKMGLLCDGCTEKGLECSRSTFVVKRKAQRAAVACDYCRSLRAKCDEGKPSCSSCKEREVECRYREPPPKVTRDMASLSSAQILHSTGGEPIPKAGSVPFPLFTFPLHAEPLLSTSSPSGVRETTTIPCDSCRSLKLRCDKEPYCSSCKEKGLKCRRHISQPLMSRSIPLRPRPQTSCNNCHSEKSKCDEGRPACGSCRQNGVGCCYPAELKTDIRQNTTIPVGMGDVQTNVAKKEKGLEPDTKVSSGNNDSNTDDWYMVTHGEVQEDISEDFEVL